MYKITYTKRAVRALATMPRNTALLISDKIRLLAEDPYAARPAIKKLHGRTGYRLRVGDWRVIYEIVDDQLVIMVLDVGPRGEIYR